MTTTTANKLRRLRNGAIKHNRKANRSNANESTKPPLSESHAASDAVGSSGIQPEPLAIEFRAGARTVAKAEWRYPTVLNGHMDALTFSAPIELTDRDFADIDSAWLASVRAEATICLE